MIYNLLISILSLCIYAFKAKTRPRTGIVRHMSPPQKSDKSKHCESCGHRCSSHSRRLFSLRHKLPGSIRQFVSSGFHRFGLNFVNTPLGKWHLHTLVYTCMPLPSGHYSIIQPVIQPTKVKIGDGSVQTLCVRASDRCKDAAERFISENSLKARVGTRF